MKKISKIIVAASALLLVASMAFAGGAQQKSKVQVGIVLPTKDEPRWVQDEARFMEALKGQANV
ncbi:MAG TPA: sugar ABC transporter substrate-binding protein, partial [Treponemataceae bacterium]|nr:sugar ABC transporter substrate-binding protein [Treponemataceae bacterium]